MGEDVTRRQRGFATRAIHAATTPPPVEQTPNAVPIYQSVTFSARDAAELGDLLGEDSRGYAYSRLRNPTSDALGSAIAELEGAEDGVAFASGMAAIHAAVTSLLRAGDHLVCTRAVYGSTYMLFTTVLRRFGVEVTFVDPTDLEAVEQAFTERTRLLYLETISNPTIVVADLAALVALAHARGVPVFVDNTFASPAVCRPIELGTDLVVESCTKWIGGHSDVLAGAVSGSRAAVARVRQVQVETGGGAAPFSAFLVLRGIATLALRMERHSSNALALARDLAAHEAVSAVFYPGLPDHPQASVAQRQLRSGGGMLAFEMPTRVAAAAVLDALELAPMTASLGSVFTIAIHPPSTSHRQLDAEGLRAAGIPEGLVRVSVGLEDLEDIVADFAGALGRARSAVPA